MTEHRWQLVAQQRQQQKSICVKCGCSMLKTESSGSFPQRRFTTRDGYVQHGKAPACITEMEAA
jgi:hypothetical protein